MISVAWFSASNNQCRSSEVAIKVKLTLCALSASSPVALGFRLPAILCGRFACVLFEGGGKEILACHAVSRYIPMTAAVSLMPSNPSATACFG
jgi:hypothetical protein